MKYGRSPLSRRPRSAASGLFFGSVPLRVRQGGRPSSRPRARWPDQFMRMRIAEALPYPLTAEYLREVMSLRQTSGVLLWLRSPGQERKGWDESRAHWKPVANWSYNLAGVPIKCSRLAWMHVTGECPRASSIIRTLTSRTIIAAIFGPPVLTKWHGTAMPSGRDRTKGRRIRVARILGSNIRDQNGRHLFRHIRTKERHTPPIRSI